MQFSSIWAHVTLDNERSVGEVVISDCVADDTFQTKIACDEQRRRSPAVDPATSELVELRHVAVDPLGALQTQVFVLQLLQLSLTLRRTGVRHSSCVAFAQTPASHQRSISSRHI